MAQILTGQRVNNAHHYTINLFDVTDGAAPEMPTISLENILQPEGETFYYNLTTIEGVTPGKSYKITCQAHAATGDSIWTDSPVQTVKESYEIIPETNE